MLVDSWQWVPGKSVGPFQFGSDANLVIEQFGLRKLEPDCSIADWNSYEIPGCESRISTEDNKISSVSCWDSLYYNERDILNMSLIEARALFGTEEGVKSIGKDAMVLFYDSMGLTLFFDGEWIESAICGECLTSG